MMLEDVGNRFLYTEPVASASTVKLYRDSITILGHIASITANELSDPGPLLDLALFRREIAQTKELFLRPALGDGPELTELAARLDEICVALDEDSTRTCHRDFMARNLAITGESAEGRQSVIVLDHQDATQGPPHYDLASLLNDSLRLSQSQRRELETEALPTADDRRSYHRCVVQRCFKIIGTFCAFARTGRTQHVPLIPPTVDRALSVLETLDESDSLTQKISTPLRRQATKLQRLVR